MEELVKKQAEEIEEKNKEIEALKKLLDQNEAELKRLREEIEKKDEQLAILSCGGG